MEIGELSFDKGNSFFTIFKNDIYAIHFTHDENGEVIRICMKPKDVKKYRAGVASNGKVNFSRADRAILTELEEAQRTINSVEVLEKTLEQIKTSPLTKELYISFEKNEPGNPKT